MICINDNGYYLTRGKFYDIQYESNGRVWVINDIGKISDYPKHIFE